MLVPSRDHGVAMRYQVRWREGTVQRKENFVKLREAQDRAKAIDTDMRRGQYVDVRDQRITFEEYAETWRTAQPHRPGTAKDVEQSLRCYAYPAFGAQRLASIRSSSLEAWATGLVKTQGLAPSTARKVFQKVKAVFNAAVRDGLVLRSPCAGVKLTKVPHTEVVPLTRDEVERLTTAVPDRYRALVVLAAGSGLRPGELFGLQVRHVNFLGRSVKVEQQLQQTTGHGVYVGPPKTERSHRTVPLSKTVLDALERHLERYPAVGDDYLFRMERGGPIVRTDFYGPIWQAAVKAAGLPKGTRMHDLRHTYASLLIRHGEGPKTVAVRLGDSVAVAMRVYAHLWPDEDEGTREAVEDFFAPPPSAPDVPSAAA
ncbi:site-specific integrase [Streptomyces sp. S1A]|uniref:tyrosine-type recombinase/integrase n=1 Tax=Streptomyces sp. ICN903 TaxID=2964654 RepID=UPI001EDB7D89|nr:site-specific integrase [Streptomyces sp. ICN903]MCG3040264.1 site-specific integrase [Streptomyces sp. ICN903]